jgi:hypothetical protein
MKQLNILNMTQFQITNAIFHVLSSAPSSPLEGQYYYNSVSKALEWHNGTTFISPIARANHTGTQLAATISDFNTTVRANSLDQMTAPAADVAWNSKKITGLLDPTNAQDAATKNYVDIQVQSAAAGIDSKPSVRVIATSNIALTGLQTIDGVTLIAGDRVLVQNNTTATQNGVYVVASGAWTRATDADATGEITPVHSGLSRKARPTTRPSGVATTPAPSPLERPVSPSFSSVHRRLTPRATASACRQRLPRSGGCQRRHHCRSQRAVGRSHRCAQPFLGQRRRCLGDQHRRHSQPEHSGRGGDGA